MNCKLYSASHISSPITRRMFIFILVLCILHPYGPCCISTSIWIVYYIDHLAAHLPTSLVHVYLYWLYIYMYMDHVIYVHLFEVYIILVQIHIFYNFIYILLSQAVSDFYNVIPPVLIYRPTCQCRKCKSTQAAWQEASRDTSTWNKSLNLSARTLCFSAL